MALMLLMFSVLWSFAEPTEIELLECDPPDLPVWGGYGPQQTYYIPGDVIHYYCDVDTYIGGNFYRKCLDTGDWTGDTPVCDAPSAFSSTTQSSDVDDDSTSELAVDGIRSSCTETIGGEKEEWSGTFLKIGELIRVMIFLPKGPVSYEVVLVKPNGEELICGSQTTNMDRYDWTFHNCPGPNNLGASGLKIRSLSNEPLKICEIQAHVLTSPRCVDPHVRIENGRLRLSRKTATLVCDRGYTKSPDTKLECIREGEWNRKTLYCLERQWELDDRERPTNPGTDGGRDPEREPNRDEPERERFQGNPERETIRANLQKKRRPGNQEREQVESNPEKKPSRRNPERERNPSNSEREKNRGNSERERNRDNPEREPKITDRNIREREKLEV